MLYNLKIRGYIIQNLNYTIHKNTKIFLTFIFNIKYLNTVRTNPKLKIISIILNWVLKLCYSNK